MWGCGRVMNGGRVLAGAVLMAGLAGLAQKPDLHGGGAKPSEIENHKATQIVLPGAHLAGATLTVHGACSLAGYTASENQIVMQVAANRALTDHDGVCYLHVKNAAGFASTWVQVKLTDRESAQAEATKRAADMKRAENVIARSGSEWTMHFANGGTDTYKRKPASGEPQVPVFADKAGREVKILVSDSSTVLILPNAGRCYLTGKLVGGHVLDGVSSGSCKQGGAWTADMR